MEVLPEDYKDAARRLPAAAARLVGVPGSGPPLSAAEAEQVAEMVSTLVEVLHDDDSETRSADAILSDDRLLLALLRLVAFAVRGLGQSDPALHSIAFSSLDAGSELLGLGFYASWRGRAIMDFGRKLLRMQTLQCCSRALAESAAGFAAGGASGQAAGGPVGEAANRAAGGAAGGEAAGGAADVAAGRAAGGASDVAAGEAADEPAGGTSGEGAGGAAGKAVGEAAAGAAGEAAGGEAAAGAAGEAAGGEAAAGAAVEAAGGSAEAAAGAQALQARRLDLLPFMKLSVFGGMLILALRLGDAVGPGNTARQLQQLQQLQRLFVRELAAAVRDSCVLEQFARWVLLVVLEEAAGRLNEGSASCPVRSIVLTLRDIIRMAPALEADGAAAPSLRKLLSGPCVRHLALSTGLAALCDADGGASHGLPPELLLHFPFLGCQELRGLPGREEVDRDAFVPMLRVLDASITAPAAPPQDWRSVAGLLRRVCLLAVESGRGRGQRVVLYEVVLYEVVYEVVLYEVVLYEVVLYEVVLYALEQLRRLIDEQRAGAAAGVAASAALAEAEVAWWRLGADVATHCVRWADLTDLGPLANLFNFELGPLPTNGVLPDAAPRCLSAPLAGGLLPLWERLLRRAGCGRVPEAALLMHMMCNKANYATILCLLAYGEQHRAAALVATWGKLLRTLAVPALLAQLTSGGAGADSPQTLLAYALIDCTQQLLLGVRGQLEARGYLDSSATGASVPQRQLARLLPCAVCEWLPPLARLAREGLPLLRQGALCGQPHPMPACAAGVVSCALAVVQWLPVLAGCSRAAPGQAQAQAAAPTVPTVPTASTAAPVPSGAAAGWRRFLLQEVGAVALLGAYCQDTMLTRDPGHSSQPGVTPALMQACYCVAAVCPADVRQAVLAAAAEAAAAGSSGGRRCEAGGGRRRGGRGGSGRGGGAGNSRAAAADLAGWSPQLLQLLAAELGLVRSDTANAAATIAAALARQAELWVAGGGEGGAELVWESMPRDPHDSGWAWTERAARALGSSPAEPARALLRTCANPACANLRHDSEASVELKACVQCGAVWHCGLECMAAHWQAGHREACVGRSPAAAADAAPLDPPPRAPAITRVRTLAL
ncbi:hypothetical protein TSOC_012678 [Tetrabaena socialis]|uniref:MYND-type domain-containing protein n=1 Tax=Tetrabaena socialis TaxID=47790 RepID=A0A2J7ZME0_9CHLO|nr:hypothetical protein TSOC_012678 [Tetrabaena socialis]|eukprot:PNH01433.1 hypothetical protein TSOC_012678 [Tetrabaena socialis]